MLRHPHPRVCLISDLIMCDIVHTGRKQHWGEPPRVLMTDYSMSCARGKMIPVFLGDAVSLRLRTSVRVALEDNSERALKPGRSHIPQDLVHMDPPILQLRFRVG